MKKTLIYATIIGASIFGIVVTSDTNLESFNDDVVELVMEDEDGFVFSHESTKLMENVNTLINDIDCKDHQIQSLDEYKSLKSLFTVPENIKPSPYESALVVDKSKPLIDRAVKKLSDELSKLCI